MPIVRDAILLCAAPGAGVRHPRPLGGRRGGHALGRQSAEGHRGARILSRRPRCWSLPSQRAASTSARPSSSIASWSTRATRAWRSCWSRPSWTKCCRCPIASRSCTADASRACLSHDEATPELLGYLMATGHRPSRPLRQGSLALATLPERQTDVGGGELRHGQADQDAHGPTSSATVTAS